MAVSPYNGERLPAGVLDMLEITVTPCVPPECRMLTAIHEDSPSDGERPDKGLVPIEIELYVTDAMPTPTPTTAGRAASGRNHEDESDSESSDQASDTALEYPWSAPEQAQRDLAIQLRDSSLLPECTEDYFRWRTETKVARETTSAAPPSTDFWSAPGCKGVPDRLVEGPPRTPSPP